MALRGIGAPIGIQVFEAFETLVSEPWLRRIAERVLRPELGRPLGPVSVVVADDETVRELNRRHRGLDEWTDVLSFSFSHQGEYHGDGPPQTQWSEGFPFVTPPGEGVGLGEVIISYPQVVRQAREAGRSPESELASVLAHGILHLLGYDHVEPDQEAAMRAKEAEALAQALQDE